MSATTQAADLDPENTLLLDLKDGQVRQIVFYEKLRPLVKILSGIQPRERSSRLSIGT